MTEEEFRTGNKTKSKSKKIIALRDFHLFCPPHIDIKIKKGDDLAEIPKMFQTNLIIEEVIKG